LTSYIINRTNSAFQVDISITNIL